jgi:hypothetical protein
MDEIHRIAAPTGGLAADRIVQLTLWTLAAMAVLFLVWPVWRATLPLEIWGNEGWNAHHADNAFDPQALYPSPDGFVANNYPPLSYLLIKTLALLFGDALYVSRVVSVFSVLSLGGLVVFVARQFGGSRLSSAIGGAWFVATMARFFDIHVGMNEPQLLGQAFMCGGFAWFIARQRAGRAVEPAVLAMVAAGFIKHNLIAYPAVALIWLALHDRRLALRATLAGAAAAAAGLALCAWIYAPNFVADMLMPRTLELARALRAVGHTQFILPALVLWAIWVWGKRRTEAARFTMLLVGATVATYYLQKLGAGVEDNAQFDLVFATGVGIGIAFDRLQSDPLRSGWTPAQITLLVAAVLVARLLASSRLEFAYVLLSPSYRAEAAQNVAAMHADVARIAAMPGAVSCENRLVCRMAGKGFVYDNFFVGQRMATGRTTEAEIGARLSVEGIKMVTNDPRGSADSILRRW